MSAGCSSNNKGKIEGTKWSNEEIHIKGEHVEAGAWVLEFKDDGSLTYWRKNTHKNVTEEFSGTYELGRGDLVTLKYTESESKVEHTETVQIDGDLLTMIDGDGTKTKFRKVKE